MCEAFLVYHVSALFNTYQMKILQSVIIMPLKNLALHNLFSLFFRIPAIFYWPGRIEAGKVIILLILFSIYLYLELSDSELMYIPDLLNW